MVKDEAMLSPSNSVSLNTEYRAVEYAPHTPRHCQENTDIASVQVWIAGMTAFHVLLYEVCTYMYVLFV